MANLGDYLALTGTRRDFGRKKVEKWQKLMKSDENWLKTCLTVLKNVKTA